MSKLAPSPGRWAAPLLALSAADTAVRRPRAGRLRAGLFAGAAVLMAGGLMWTIVSRTTPPTETHVLAAPPAVVALGYLEPESTIVRVSASGGGNGMSAKVGAVLVGDGDVVQAGQVLALLDTTPRLAAQVASAEAQVRLKRLLIEQQRLDLANTIASRRAALERAQAQLALTQAEFTRQQSLVAGNVVSRSSYDRAARDYRSDRATIAEMEAALVRLQATTDDGGQATQIDVAVAEAALANAEADLAVARASLAEATLRAPFAGRVLTLSARSGEQVGSDGLLELGDVSHMRAVVEVYQTDIGRVQIGETVQLRADALPGPVSGQVTRIGAVVQRQTVVNNDPAAATDARVVQVFVALDEPTSRTVAGLSRLQVRARFSR